MDAADERGEVDAEAVDESTLPSLPIWPIWLGAAIAAAGLVVFAFYPTQWMFWLGLPLSQVPLWAAYWRRWERAKNLGYREPDSSNNVPEVGEIWGAP